MAAGFTEMNVRDDTLSPLHRLWRLLPRGGRRRVFAAVTAAVAARPDRVAPAARGGVVVVGAFGEASGLGESARVMRRAIAGLGVATWAVDTALGAVPDLPDGAPLLIHVNAPMLPAALLRLPRRLVRGRLVIGYWAWELPVVPESWRVGLGFVHEIWTNSTFTAAAMRTLVTAERPIAVRPVPIPVALAPPVASGRGRAEFGLPEGAVVVLTSFNLASSLVRKNPQAAIAAFRRAFGERADRVLVVKVGNPGHFPEDFAGLRALVAGVGNIRLFSETLSAGDTHALTAAADIVLSLHRSEGFGLVPAEAMMLGRPVIATGWSGNMDFMDAECAALVDYTLVPARDPRGVFEAPGAMWAEPDIGHAAEHLVRLADDEGARVDLGRRGRAAARARLGAGAVRAAVSALGLEVPG